MITVTTHPQGGWTWKVPTASPSAWIYEGQYFTKRAALNALRRHLPQPVKRKAKDAKAA